MLIMGWTLVVVVVVVVQVSVYQHILRRILASVMSGSAADDALSTITGEGSSR
jgi:hypothetical protein